MKTECSNVVSAPGAARQNQVAEQLAAARTEWLRNADEKSLRCALLDVLQQLEEGA